MPRPLPVYSGRVQGRLYRPRQLSGSSSILEVPCQSSTNCVIKPATTKAGNAGTVAARCCQPRTMIQPGAPRNTFARDAMGAKMFSKTSWLLVGSATTDVTGENCHSHRRSTESLCVIDFPQGDGSLLVVAKVRSLQALMSAFERARSVPQWQEWGALLPGSSRRHWCWHHLPCGRVAPATSISEFSGSTLLHSRGVGSCA